MNILERIERAEVPVSSILTPQDQQFIHLQLQEYERIRQHLLRALNDFEERLAKVVYPSQVTERNGEYGVKIHPERTGYYQYMYEVAGDIAQVKNKLCGLNTYLTNEVTKHINRTYYLAIEFPSFGIEKISEGNMLEVIQGFSEGSTLQGLGIERLKSNFSEKVYRPIRIKNRVLQIDGFTYIREVWDGGYRLDHSETEKFNILYQAVSYFEQQTISYQLPCLSQLPGNDYNHIDIELKEYSIQGSQTVDGIRFFKNRRLDIRFKTFELAQSFADTFRLPLA